MKIRLVDDKLKTIHETTLEGKPPDAIYLKLPDCEDQFFTRIGITDGTAVYRPGFTGEING